MKHYANQLAAARPSHSVFVIHLCLLCHKLSILSNICIK